MTKTETMDHKINGSGLCEAIPNFSYLKSRLTGAVFALQVETLGPFDSDHHGRDDSRQRQEEKNDGHQEENVQRPISPLPKRLDVCVAPCRHSAVSFFYLGVWFSESASAPAGFLPEMIQTASALQPGREGLYGLQGA